MADYNMNREQLLIEFKRVRGFSEAICQPLAVDDFQIQSIIQTSPPKWHLAHTTWFFETFILLEFRSDYKCFHPRFDYLFNSYYYTHGMMQPRPERGLLSRPTISEIIEYRNHADEAIYSLILQADDPSFAKLQRLLTLGINHEQQHQELLFMDIKHNFSVNPLKPAYRENLSIPTGDTYPVRWVEREGGLHSIGHHGTGFSFDNETPRHSVLLYEHRMADRLITNSEYLEFIQDGGYQHPALWLADGWSLLQTEDWQSPLYWTPQENNWSQFTLGGERPLTPNEPVCHISYYEADAYARWAGKRLPKEEELEISLSDQSIVGNFAETDLLHPAPAGKAGQWYGDLWNWTASAYASYPGFKPLSGTMGEYNGKFMANQMVLKGGSCATPSGHTRPSYRNFFYPNERWMFSGLRLAEDA